MVNLIFYSDQIIPQNAAVDERLLTVLTSNGRARRIGYIASGPEPDRRFFQDRMAYYARLELELPIFYDLDESHTQAENAALFGCGAIHLSGGHTGGFLGRLKQSGLMSRLRV